MLPTARGSKRLPDLEYRGPNIITPDGSTVWVASEYYPGAYPLSELDASGTFIGGVHGGPALSGPQCVVSTGTDIWVTDFGGLYEYNAHSGKYLKEINTGTVPVDISYHGGILWAYSDTGINPLDEFSTVTGARFGSYQTLTQGVF